MSKKTINVLSSVFIGLTLGLYIIILGGLSSHKNVMTYIPVALAFIYSIVILSNQKRSWFLALALLFTATSDVFLMLVTPRNQALAMFTFSLAQIFHFLRLFTYFKSKKERVIHLIVRLALCVIIEIVAVIVVKQAFDLVVLFSVFYFVNLVLNFIVSIRYFTVSPLLTFGFACFICCDLFVGFSAAAGIYLDIPENSIFYKFAYPDFDYVSLFYVPSQALIALSGNADILNKNSLFAKKPNN